MSSNIERDWVQGLGNTDSPEPSKLKPVEPRTHIMDSSWELRKGCEATELDTIPAELLDYFK